MAEPKRMTLMEKLTRLDAVDRQVRGLRSRLENARRYLEAQKRQHGDVSLRREELERRQLQIKARIANLEMEGAALDEQLEKFRNDLNTSATNKQYTAVLTELNTVKAARSKLDDGILAEMDEAERLDEETKLVDGQLDERRKVLALAEAQLQEREEEVGARLAELESEREAAAADIPAAELAVFEEMADAHDGQAMAKVEEIEPRRREYSCGECHIQLPFNQVAALMSETSGVVRCPACGRILFLREETRGALTPK